VFQLLEVIIAADAAPWRAAGFAVETVDGADACRIGSTTLGLFGASADGGEAITRLAIEGLGPGELDGLALIAAGAAMSMPAPAEHPNGVTGIDHLVVRSPDVDRTTAALVDAGLELRRERRFPAAEATVRQSFFWMGDVICELVGDDTAHDPGPAVAWGLALTATDLDRVAAVAGDAATAPKPAVQPGRHITSIHGLGLPVAVMTPHRKR
jgi:hypothetical protein